MSKAHNSPPCARPVIALTAVTTAFPRSLGSSEEAHRNDGGFQDRQAFEPDHERGCALAHHRGDRHVGRVSRHATKGTGTAMNCWTRRQFGCLAGAACLTAVAPRVVRSQTKARVVVIGGGIGGATVAKYLAASAAGIEVTLVEPKPRYRPASSAPSISPGCARSNCLRMVMRRWHNDTGSRLLQLIGGRIGPILVAPAHGGNCLF